MRQEAWDNKVVEKKEIIGKIDNKHCIKLHNIVQHSTLKGT